MSTDDLIWQIMSSYSDQSYDIELRQNLEKLNIYQLLFYNKYKDLKVISKSSDEDIIKGNHLPLTEEGIELFKNRRGFTDNEIYEVSEPAFGSIKQNGDKKAFSFSFNKIPYGWPILDESLVLHSLEDDSIDDEYNSDTGLLPSITIYISSIHGDEIISSPLYEKPFTTIINSTGRLGIYNQTCSNTIVPQLNFFKKFYKEHAKPSVYKANEKLEKFYESYYIENGIQKLLKEGIVKPDWRIPKIYFPKDITSELFEKLPDRHREYNQFELKDLKFLRKAIHNKNFTLSTKNLKREGVFIISTNVDFSLPEKVKLNFLKKKVNNLDDLDKINLIKVRNWKKIFDTDLSSEINFDKFDNFYLQDLLFNLNQLGYEVVNIIDGSCRSVNGYATTYDLDPTNFFDNQKLILERQESAKEKQHYNDLIVYGGKKTNRKIIKKNKRKTLKNN